MSENQPLRERARDYFGALQEEICRALEQLDGEGVFLLEGRELSMGTGDLLVAPEGVAHGVRNNSSRRLLVLAILAPAPHK